MLLTMLGKHGVKIESKVEPIVKGKTGAFLYYLAYQGDWVSREDLIYLFWPDNDDKQARSNLRSLLSRSIGKVDYAELTVERDRIRWDIETDISQLKQALAEDNSEYVIKYYAGNLLEDYYCPEAPEFENWLDLEREKLLKKFKDQAERLESTLMSQERYEECLDVLKKVLDVDPFDEQTFRRFLKITYLAGGKAKAQKELEHYERKLTKELGIGAEPATKKLFDDLSHLSQDEAQAKSRFYIEKAIANNLPEWLAGFIGRCEELKTLAEYLSQPDKRLISLVGLGGMGKTRLALELAKLQLEKASFAGGVFFVALDALNDGMSIPFEIADAMNLQLRGDLKPLDLLIKQINNRTCLIVLDNYEHLIEAAPLCHELLQACPNLKLLVTSREKLNVSEEWVYPLRGLSKRKTSSLEDESTTFPNAEASEESPHQDAVSLFEYSAKQDNPNFELNKSNQADVQKICQMVDGSPLAIQLASSWMKLLSPAEIVSELKENLDLLSSQSRTANDRHQSIEAAFEHSWQLLPAKEQEVLRKLSVFQGGFNREAAKAIASANLLSLSSLVDKSLIRVSSQDRFDLHPLLKQFAALKLAISEEEQKQTQEQHALFFASLIENVFVNRIQAQAKKAVPETPLLQHLSRDYENALASFRWLISNRTEQDIFKVINGFGFLISFNLRFTEGELIWQDAQDQLKKVDNFHRPSLATLMSYKAWCLMEQGFFEDAFSEIQKAIEFLDSEPAHYVHWFAFNASCHFSRKIGLFAQGKDHGLKAIEFANSLGLEQQKFMSKSELAIVLYLLGDYEHAEHILKECDSYYKQKGNRYLAFFLVWTTLIDQGELNLITKNYVKARDFLETSLNGLRNQRKHTALMRCLDTNAILELEEKNITKSFQLANEAVELSRELESKYYEARTLVTLGRVALAKEDFESSYKHLRDALDLAHSHTAYSTQLTALNFLAELKMKEEQYDVAYVWLEFVKQHESAEFWVKEKAEALLTKFLNSKNIAIEKDTLSNLTLDQIVSQFT